MTRHTHTPTKSTSLIMSTNFAYQTLNPEQNHYKPRERRWKGTTINCVSRVNHWNECVGVILPQYIASLILIYVSIVLWLSVLIVKCITYQKPISNIIYYLQIIRCLEIGESPLFNFAYSGWLKVDITTGKVGEGMWRYCSYIHISHVKAIAPCYTIKSIWLYITKKII